MRNTSALIIGAGIGGIATAARLARRGFQVTVLEKNNMPGGRCGRLERAGHQFDTGTTLFLLPDLYAETFADLDERLSDHLDLKRIDPTYRIFFKGGSKLDLTSDLQVMQTQLEAIEPGSFGGYLRYLFEGYRHYQFSLTHLVKRNFRGFFDYCSPRNLYSLLKLKALRRHYDQVGHYFHHPQLRAAFTFQNMYMGLNPIEAPAIYSLLPYTELAEGVWFPMGGMYRVIQALTDIAEKLGVNFFYNSPVIRIDISDQKATGVTLADGRKMQSDVVVANADLPYVYHQLLPDDGTASRLGRKKYSCSSLVFYWGLKKRYPQLGPHNLFLAGDYRQSFRPIFEAFTSSAEPNFYLHAPVRVDPTLAPDGQDTLMVAIPVGHLDENSPQNWEAILSRSRGFVLQRLAKIGVNDLEEHLKFELSFSPPDWQDRFNLVKGATHGLSHNITQMGYLRPHNRHARYRNLYFVGASTHPGTGLPTVLVSARLTTERILEDSGAPAVIHSRPAPAFSGSNTIAQ